MQKLHMNMPGSVKTLLREIARQDHLTVTAWLIQTVLREAKARGLKERKEC